MYILNRTGICNDGGDELLTIQYLRSTWLYIIKEKMLYLIYLKCLNYV